MYYIQQNIVGVRTTAQLEPMQNQLKWAEGELNNKSTALLELQKTSSAEEFSLRANMTSLETENAALKESIAAERQRTKDLGEKLTRVGEQLNEARANATVREEKFASELAAQQKLSSLP